MSFDANYYRLVADTQNDPEILSAELTDAVDEAEAYISHLYQSVLYRGRRIEELQGEINSLKEQMDQMITDLRRGR